MAVRTCRRCGRGKITPHVYGQSPTLDPDDCGYCSAPVDDLVDDVVEVPATIEALTAWLGEATGEELERRLDLVREREYVRAIPRAGVRVLLDGYAVGVDEIAGDESE